jgi:uncharacterized membrane protein YhhN
MFSKYRYFDIAYTVIFICNILFFYILTEYRMVAKPMIMVSLLGFYIYHVRIQSPLWLMAMICALLGDIFLIFNGREFFILGLIAFAIMQILYTSHFLKEREKVLPPYKYMVISAILIGGMASVAALWSQLESLKWHVLVYTVLICSMSIAAVLRNSQLPFYKVVVSGTLLFMISDFLLAFHTFVSPFPGSEPWIMSTYMAAQYLIIRGIVR